MTTVRKLPVFPPVGTRCYYKNEALGLEGWGVIAEPRNDIDASELPILTPWVGTLTGPVDPLQVGLDMLAPGVGVLPGVERYMVVPAFMLTIEDDKGEP
jgi:hypothetical protein